LVAILNVIYFFQHIMDYVMFPVFRFCCVSYVSLQHRNLL